MPLPLGPIVFRDVPAALAIAWYVISAGVIVAVTLDARQRALRWPIWLLLSVIFGPIAWMLYAFYFRGHGAAGAR